MHKESVLSETQMNAQQHIHRVQGIFISQFDCSHSCALCTGAAIIPSDTASVDFDRYGLV